MNGAHEDPVSHRAAVERIAAMRTVVGHARQQRAIAIDDEVFAAFPAHEYVFVWNLFQRADVVPLIAWRGWVIYGAATKRVPLLARDRDERPDVLFEQV